MHNIIMAVATVTMIVQVTYVLQYAVIMIVKTGVSWDL